MTVSYLTVNGVILSETRNGVESDYIPAPSGSTAALMNSSGAITDTFSYWPFGQLRSHVGSNPTPFCFEGTLGCYTDGWGGINMGAREYDPTLTRWLTVDPIWPYQPAYVYVFSNPVTFADPSGLQGVFSSGLGCPPDLAFSMNRGINQVSNDAQRCKDCDVAIYKVWFPHMTHQGNHGYSHCMACCVLTRLSGAGCAYTSQAGQNLATPSRGSSWQGRWGECSVGVGIGKNPPKAGMTSQADCSSNCFAKFPNPTNQKNLPPFPNLPQCNPS
jgi:RHS repeat-associated protein